jgi:ABC-type uncharacterized transport system permease subunit
MTAAVAIPSKAVITQGRFGRRRITSLTFAVLGVVLAVLVAPNLSGDDKSFTFERPPDPAKITFDPPTLVTVIGVLYIVLAVPAFLGDRWDRVAVWAQALSAALLIPLVLGIALALSEAAGTNVTNLLDESLVLCTPIALGAMTGLWSERSGIVNIGIEGMMLSAAGVGFMTYAVLGNGTSTGWMWFSLLIAVLTGGLLALLHAWLTVTFLINQIISGVVINLFALGLTGFLRSEVIVDTGVISGKALPEFGIPLLEDIPVVGNQLFRGQPIFFLMLLTVFLTWLVIWRTPWGLRVRSSGEHPHAAETLGIDVVKIRYQAVVLGGLIAGLAGAWFSMEASAGFEDAMTNGTGFIALAAMIFGKWRPFPALAGALLFGFSRALGARLQFLGVEIAGFEIPSNFWQMLPFVVTLVVVAGAVGRAVPPAAEGIPYRRSR